MAIYARLDGDRELVIRAWQNKIDESDHEPHHALRTVDGRMCRQVASVMYGVDLVDIDRGDNAELERAALKLQLQDAKHRREKQAWHLDMADAIQERDNARAELDAQREVLLDALRVAAANAECDRNKHEGEAIGWCPRCVAEQALKEVDA